MPSWKKCNFNGIHSLISSYSCECKHQINGKLQCLRKQNKKIIAIFQFYDGNDKQWIEMPNNGYIFHFFLFIVVVAEYITSNQWNHIKHAWYFYWWNNFSKFALILITAIILKLNKNDAMKAFMMMVIFKRLLFCCLCYIQILLCVVFAP